MEETKNLTASHGTETAFHFDIILLRDTQNTDHLNQQELRVNLRVSLVESHLRQQT